MNVLLFSMPDIYPEWEFPRVPNLGLVSVAGNCPGHKVYVGDLVLKRKDVKGAVIKAIQIYAPEIIGLSAMTFQFPTLVKVARLIKETVPSIPLVVGGYHITTSYKQVADKDYARYFDFMLRGESEISFKELLDEFESGKEFLKIRGLSYKKDNQWHHNPQRPLENLENIKLPDRDSRIWKGYHTFSKKLDTIETSRGCLNNCKFCSIRKMYGKNLREYPISRVIRDIRNAKARGTEYLIFTDDNITSDTRKLERFEELLDTIIENKLNDIRYATQASSIGVGMDERIIKKMRKAGFDMVFVGMENISPKNLQYYKKGNIINFTKRALKFLRENGIIIVAGLVNGMEEDNEEDFKLNFEYVMDANVDLLLAQILTPYPGTELRNDLLQKGLITNKDNWELYCGYFANIRTKFLSTRELNYVQWKYVNQFYDWKGRSLWKMNLLKNHRVYITKLFFLELIRKIKSAIKNTRKSTWERFEADYKTKVNINKNLL